MKIARALFAIAIVSACSSDSLPSTVDPLPAGCTLPTPQDSTLPKGTQVIELGQHTVGDRITFAVPAGTQSLTIFEQAEKANLEVVLDNNGSPIPYDNSAVPRFIYFPDGGTAYDDFNNGQAPDGGTLDPSQSYIEFGGHAPIASALTWPNTAASLSEGVPAGTWSAVVGDIAYECAQPGACLDGGTVGGVYDVKIFLHTAGTALNVNFYLVGAIDNNSGQPLTAANAASDPSVTRMLSTFQKIYDGAGITLGTVNFFDVTAAQRSAYSTITVNSTGGNGPCSELDQLLATSGAHPGNAMNLFLVDDIEDQTPQGGASVVGLDGTIPGTAGVAGTVHSGAIVSNANLFFGATRCNSAGIDPQNCGADETAYIAAHETGHFLGLFHTSESDGALFDPLVDTAECSCAQCASVNQRAACGSSSPPALDVAQCTGSSTCGGGSNLMFWVLDRQLSTGAITNDQAQVMRLNPTVQ